MEAVMGVRLEQSSTNGTHITQDPTVFEGKTPCLTQGNPKTGQATVGVAIPIADKATRYKGGGSTRNNDGSANGLGIGEPGAPRKHAHGRRQARSGIRNRPCSIQPGNECTVRYQRAGRNSTNSGRKRDRGGMPQDADGEERSNDDGRIWVA